MSFSSKGQFFLQKIVFMVSLLFPCIFLISLLFKTVIRTCSFPFIAVKFKLFWLLTLNPNSMARFSSIKHPEEKVSKARFVIMVLSPYLYFNCTGTIGKNTLFSLILEWKFFSFCLPFLLSKLTVKTFVSFSFIFSFVLTSLLLFVFSVLLLL